MSLRSEAFDPTNDNALVTMQSKDLDLNRINKTKNRQSRYDEMDSDEKTMLKSAISKVASNKDYQKK